MTRDDERARFEAWVRDTRGLGEYWTHRNGDGYESYDVSLQWEGFKAASRAAACCPGATLAGVKLHTANCPLLSKAAACELPGCDEPATLCIHHGGHDACAMDLMRAQERATPSPTAGLFNGKNKWPCGCVVWVYPCHGGPGGCARERGER